MTVTISIVPKKDPRNLGAPPKYFPTVVSPGRADLRWIAKRIASMSSISTMDTIAVLDAFLTVVPDQLLEGKIVELGEFGTFRLTVLGRGEDDPKKVTVRHIKEVKVRFKPGKEFKEELEKAEFRIRRS